MKVLVRTIHTDYPQHIYTGIGAVHSDTGTISHVRTSSVEEKRQDDTDLIVTIGEDSYPEVSVSSLWIMKRGTVHA